MGLSQLDAGDRVSSPELLENHVDPNTSSIHRDHHWPDYTAAPHLLVPCPRAEFIEILAGAVFALITEGRMSSSHLAPWRAEAIP
ncbi:MAG TPA: hypothetical protein VF469_21570 [Kofleriaceae bacterium]